MVGQNLHTFQREKIQVFAFRKSIDELLASFRLFVQFRKINNIEDRWLFWPIFFEKIIRDQRDSPSYGCRLVAIPALDCFTVPPVFTFEARHTFR